MIIAHRTAPLDAPENSVAGIRVAAAQGADAVEIDVRMTRDGELVLMHDPTAWRTVRRPLVVRRAAARRLGAQITLFDDALVALPAGMTLAVDIKDARAMPVVVERLVAADALERARLWCRSARAVAWAAAAVPKTEVALLRNTRTPAETARYLADASAAGAGAVSLHQRAVTPEAVNDAKYRGLVAYAWVVERGGHDRVFDAGVDGVVTDWVELAKASRQTRFG